MNWPEHQLPATLEIVRVWREKLVEPSPEVISACKELSRFLVNQYIKKATLSKVSLDNSYYSASHPKPNTVPDVFEIAYKYGGEETCQPLLRRIMDPKLVTKEYINHLLITLIPRLRAFTQSKQLAVTSEPFASAFRNILQLWGSVLLGPKPKEDPTILDGLRSWKCFNQACVTIRRFLTTSPDKELSLNRIGYPNKEACGKGNAAIRAPDCYDRHDPYYAPRFKGEQGQAKSRFELSHSYVTGDKN